MPGYHNYLYLRLASSHIRRSSCIYSLSIFVPPFCNTQHPPQSPRNRLSSWAGQPCYRNESHVGRFALRPNARRRRQPRTKHSSSLLSCLIDGTETYLRAASDARCVYSIPFPFHSRGTELNCRGSSDVRTLTLHGAKIYFSSAALLARRIYHSPTLHICSDQPGPN